MLPDVKPAFAWLNAPVILLFCLALIPDSKVAAVLPARNAALAWFNDRCITVFTAEFNFAKVIAPSETPPAFAAANAGATGQRAIIAIGGDTSNTGGNTPKAHFRTNGSQLEGLYYNASNNTAYWSYATMDSSTFALHIHGFYTTA